MGTLAAIGQFFRAIAESIGLVRSRSDANNAPDMKANAGALTAQDIKNEVTDAVAERDAEKVREKLAE